MEVSPPRQAIPGDTFALPKAIKDRLFQFHLVPTMTFGESNGWSPGGKQLRAGEMNLIVEEATPARVRLRLEGFAHLGAAYDEAVTQQLNWEKSGGVGYEPRLHGYLEYDPKTKAFTRFELLALGDTYGTLGGDLRYFYRPGRQPLGVRDRYRAASGGREPPVEL